MPSLTFASTAAVPMLPPMKKPLSAASALIAVRVRSAAPASGTMRVWIVIFLPFLVAKKSEWAKAYARQRERQINRPQHKFR
jgi:hypothetical protein